MIGKMCVYCKMMVNSQDVKCFRCGREEFTDDVLPNLRMIPKFVMTHSDESEVEDADQLRQFIYGYVIIGDGEGHSDVGVPLTHVVMDVTELISLMNAILAVFTKSNRLRRDAIVESLTPALNKLCERAKFDASEQIMGN